MDFLEFLRFARRQIGSILIIIFMTVLAATGIYFLQQPIQKTTLLFAVGVDAATESERSFDATKLADDFADSIAGWLQSPTFGERVSGIAGEPVAASGSAQATQNFLVELTFADGNKKDTIIAAAQQILNDELTKYNSQSKFKFFVTQQGEANSDSQSDPVKIFSAAVLGGAVLTATLLILWAYLGGRINSVREAEKLAKTRAAIIFSSPQKDEANFLKILAKKSGHAVLIGLDFNPKKLSEKLGLNLKSFELPREAEKIGKNETKIVVVRLDTSRANSLRMLRAVDGDKIQLIVWS